MKKLIMGALILCALVSLTATSARAETREQFCSRWHNVCARCEGLGARVPRHECLNTCSVRLSSCQQNGCYYFRATGEQCMGKPSR
jgi:hypothetical protein